MVVVAHDSTIGTKVIDTSVVINTWHATIILTVNHGGASMMMTILE